MNHSSLLAAIQWTATRKMKSSSERSPRACAPPLLNRILAILSIPAEFLATCHTGVAHLLRATTADTIEVDAIVLCRIGQSWTCGTCTLERTRNAPALRANGTKRPLPCALRVTHAMPKSRYGVSNGARGQTCFLRARTALERRITILTKSALCARRQPRPPPPHPRLRRTLLLRSRPPTQGRRPRTQEPRLLTQERRRLTQEKMMSGNGCGETLQLGSLHL